MPVTHTQYPIPNTQCSILDTHTHYPNAGALITGMRHSVAAVCLLENSNVAQATHHVILGLVFLDMPAAVRVWVCVCAVCSVFMHYDRSFEFDLNFQRQRLIDPPSPSPSPCYLSGATVQIEPQWPPSGSAKWLLFCSRCHKFIIHWRAPRGRHIFLLLFLFRIIYDIAYLIYCGPSPIAENPAECRKCPTTCDHNTWILLFVNYLEPSPAAGHLLT